MAGTSPIQGTHVCKLTKKSSIGHPSVNRSPPEESLQIVSYSGRVHSNRAFAPVDAITPRVTSGASLAVAIFAPQPRRVVEQNWNLLFHSQGAALQTTQSLYGEYLPGTSISPLRIGVIYLSPLPQSVFITLGWPQRKLYNIGGAGVAIDF